MLGPTINAIAIIICTLIGITLHGRIPEKINDTVHKAIGLSVMFLGLQNAFKVNSFILLVFSMVLGSIIGEWIDIDLKLENLGNWIQSKVGSKEGSISQGFVTASLIFCIGSMAVIGSLQSGLEGNHEMLITKSILDGFISILLASTMGIGVIFSSIMVFLYEGSIVLGASLLKTLINDVLLHEIIREVSAVGGLIITALGLNFLKVDKIKAANMLPALIFPFIYLIIVSFI